MATAKPLDSHQQELLNIVATAHENLSVSRKLRSTELSRRLALADLDNRQKTEAKLSALGHQYEHDKAMIKLAAEREIETIRLGVKDELDAELVTHEVALDDALIAAYETDIPIRQIALDGFRNRYDGAVHQLLVKLRNDGRIGNREGYQRNTGESRTVTTFPQPVNVNEMLNASLSVAAPTFTKLEAPLVLVPADKNGNDEFSVPAVRLDMDKRDPFFQSIEKNARKDTKFLRATSCTLYRHPATGEITAFESAEPGETIWDHPVARWVKDHKEEAEAGFLDAINAK